MFGHNFKIKLQMIPLLNSKKEAETVNLGKHFTLMYAYKQYDHDKGPLTILKEQ